MPLRIFRRKNKKKQSGLDIGQEEQVKKEMEVISVTIDDVRRAINDYATSLEKGISLRSLVLDNNKLDYELLYRFLGGVPDKDFYMSKETFEIFEDETLPKYIDMCQLAVDQYLKATGEWPVIQGNPYHKISYFKLSDYLKERPPIDLYLHPMDQMVTHRIPKDNT